MLNNGGQSQNDAYPGIQAYQQYGQNMASTLNAPPAGYGGQQKRVAMQQGLQPGIQPSMAGTRQPAQRSNVARFPATQYPANRGLPHQAGLTSPSVTSSIAPIRQGHSQFATNSGMQSGAVPYGAHQSQASQQHATPQQHPAARVNPERRPNVFEVPFQPSGMPPTPQQQGTAAQQTRDTGAFARFSRPAGATATAVGSQKGLAINADYMNGKDEGILDSSDFPALGGMAAGRASSQDIAAGLSSMRLVGIPPVQPTAVALNAGKKLDANEFPALSGVGSAAVAPNGLSRLPLQRRLVRNQMPPSGDAAAQQAWTAHLQQKGTEEDREGSSEDKYRLLDLLPLCPSHRRREDSDDRQLLSIGVDVETLGLNLCAPDNVYPMLASPYHAGGSGGTLEKDLPKCYLFDAPDLTAESLQKLSEGTLLFLFYAYAGDERQLWAAAELQRRDWFWHKVLQQWWKKEKVTQFVSQHNMVAMRGSFIAWDAKAWRAKRHPENTTVEEHVAELIPTLQALKAAKDLKAAPR